MTSRFFFSRFAKSWRERKNQIIYASKATLIAATWVPVVAYFANHVVWIGVIDGASMTPTLNPESNGLIRDIALLWKFGSNNYNTYKRGDIVVLRNPRDPESSVVKRILAFEGETVRTRFPYPESTCTVPERHLWIEGDNIHSIDSNTYGPVPHRLVDGKVTRILFPFDRIGPVSATGGRNPKAAVVDIHKEWNRLS
ncbi:peptidase S24/S26A/S26B/S26C [Lipomyces japonicus]|uniref:peptidase S24/S26A/S26B/S26C n=1 Tax=Lipomyces japonicus TaxID=56871 RepID=UPI0034CE06A0